MSKKAANKGSGRDKYTTTLQTETYRQQMAVILDIYYKIKKK